MGLQCQAALHKLTQAAWQLESSPLGVLGFTQDSSDQPTTAESGAKAPCAQRWAAWTLSGCLPSLSDRMLCWTVLENVCYTARVCACSCGLKGAALRQAPSTNSCVPEEEDKLYQQPGAPERVLAAVQHLGDPLVCHSRSKHALMCPKGRITWHQQASCKPLTSHTAEVNSPLMLPAESKDGVKWEKKGPVIKPNREDDAAYDRGGLGLTGIAEVDGEIWLPTFGVSRIIKVRLHTSVAADWQQQSHHMDPACPAKLLLLEWGS